MYASDSASLEPVHPLIAEVQSLYRDLLQQESLRPGVLVDRLFSRLVHLAKTPLSDEASRSLLGHQPLQHLLPALRDLCAKSEVEMAYHWATRWLAARHVQQDLQRFPYDSNYRDLSHLEASARRLAGLTRRASILFVGAGPLPLSAYFLAHEHGARLSIMDCDAEALRLAALLLLKLGHQDICCLATDAASFTAYANYDVVLLASLVGQHAPAKAGLLRHMAGHMHHGQHLLVRSAHKLRRLLYPEIDETSLPGFVPELTLHPHNDIINSVILARRAP